MDEMGWMKGERGEDLERDEGGWGAAANGKRMRSTADSCIWGSGWMCGRMDVRGDGMGEMDASVHLLGIVPDTVPSERR